MHAVGNGVHPVALAVYFRRVHRDFVPCPICASKVHTRFAAGRRLSINRGSDLTAAREAKSLRLAQPRTRSAVLRVNEDDAGIFERALNCFDGACLQRIPALEPLHRLL
jgi:hypothetical protein